MNIKAISISFRFCLFINILTNGLPSYQPRKLVVHGNMVFVALARLYIAICINDILRSDRSCLTYFAVPIISTGLTSLVFRQKLARTKFNFIIRLGPKLILVPNFQAYIMLIAKGR